ncbi:MAG TPA: TIGR00282 family metallophosphoesterase [Candidatus Polarisedimenticolia bacterium]|nr:TIGR00282 family metallophosphoesterase [Candidatus Polarisedimenticolia bacterium]
MSINVLFIGDIVGKPGLRILDAHFARTIDKERIDYSVANVENSADGQGVTPEIAEDLFALGLDCLTSGNHIWDKREIRDYMSREARLLRPINYPADMPGRGVHIGETAAGTRVGVVNVMGRVFMPAVDDPFRSARGAVEEIRQSTPVVLVDMHAEATSEKMAMAWYLDGLASAVVGTHTHVQTADERVLTAGTAFISDVGMTGPYDSIIGMEKEAVMARFLHHSGSRMTPAKGDPRFCAVVIRIDEQTGRADSITRLMLGAD